MSPWNVLIGTLTDSPTNHPTAVVRGNPNVKEMQAEKKATSYQLIRDCLEGFGGTATAKQIAEMTQRSYPYVCNVCNNMLAEGEIICYMESDGKARRKYWKVLP